MAPTTKGVFGRSPHAHPNTVRLAGRARDVGTLGPGQRAVLYVAGCPLQCRGCIVADSWVPVDSGTDTSVATILEWLAGMDGLDGLTISGGEPMWQPDALTTVVDGVRDLKPAWNIMLYTGWRAEAIEARGDDGHRRLMRSVDLLVDGPFVQSRRHPSRLWRGSDQQRLIAVTTAGREMVAGRSDTGVGHELHVQDTRVMVVGVPESAVDLQTTDRWLGRTTSREAAVTWTP